MSIAFVREPPPDNLTVIVRPPGGAPARWAEDEARAENVIEGLSKSGEMPGGHKEASGTLARNPQLQWGDLDEYGDVEVVGSTGEKVWEGRLEHAPESSGDRLSISPGAVGHQAVLNDNKVKAGYIHKDLDAFTGASRTRRVAEMTAGTTPIDPAVDVDAQNVLPALRMTIEDVWTNFQVVTAQLDCGAGLKASSMYVDRQTISSTGAAQPDVSFFLNGFAAIDDVLNGYEQGADLHTVAAGSGSGWYTPSVAKRVIGFTWAHAAGGAASHVYEALLRKVTVLGEHAAGMALAGAAPGTLTAKQMLLHLVPTFASPLTATADSLDDDGFGIDHAWFGEPTTPAEIVRALTRFGLYDWFVLTAKLFELREPGTYGRRWKSYIGPSGLQEAGMDAQRLWEEIIVSFQDTDGTTKTVGPPGAPVDVQDARLQITDPDHPAVKADVTRRDLLEMARVSTSEGAISVGMRFLEEAHLINRAGSATLTGYVLDDRGILWPASYVQPGDWLMFPDAADTSYRKIVQPNYTHDDRTAAVDLDAPPSGLEALLERLQSVLVPLGLG